MSRSNPDGERLINPAVKFFEFNGADGCFEYYDKEAVNPNAKNGKGVKVKVPLPFSFVVLEDGLATITGFSDSKQNGFYSNEVRSMNLKTDKFFVRCGKDKEAEGTYEQIKRKEFNYTASVYIAWNAPVFENGVRVTKEVIKDGNPVKIGVSELAIANIKMSGACLNGWIDFRKEVGMSIINANAISVKSCSDEKKGAVNYKKPIFTVVPISPETNQKAIALDLVLQEYLKKYFEVGSPLSKSTPEEEKKIAEESHADNIPAAAAEIEKKTAQAVNDFMLPEGLADDLPF